MTKNSQVHLFLKSEMKEKLEREALESGVSVSELCRCRIFREDRLREIEEKVDVLLGMLEGRIDDK